MNARNVLKAIGALVLLVVLSACGGPPEDLKQRFDAIPDRIEGSYAALKTAEKSYKAQLSSNEFSFAGEYTAEQLRTDRFNASKVHIDAANSVFKKGIEPLVDKYEDTDAARLKTLLDQVDADLSAAKADANAPSRWLSVVKNTKDDTGSVITDAETTAADYETQFSPIGGEALANAKQQFPKQTTKIDEKYAPIATQFESSSAALATLKNEADKSNPNYAVIAGAADTIRTASKDDGLDKFKAELDGLSVRETHTLVDIRVDSTLYIERTTWDDSYDFPDEHDYAYPGVKIDTETANYFAKFAPGTVLAKSVSGSWGDNFRLEDVSKDQWAKLKIDPEAKWDDGDTDAEYYMGELEDIYCHKQKVIKNGRPDSSGKPADDDPCSQYNTAANLAAGIYWMEGDELMADAIGMDIYSKAYGDFADQATTAATPPGMAYVGDPKTGEWRQDENGNSFWYYYGLYRFFGDLIGGPSPYYYRSDYNRWNRDYRYAGKPFYDTDSGGTPRFGGRSPQTASRFPSSNFSTSGLSSATIRNSGPVARAGGPGGGGK